MKIITVIGARPQFIKAAVVSRALIALGHCQELIVHTGQHYDANMSEVFFSELGIPEPHFNLSVSEGSHGQQTGRMLEKIEETLLQERPDWVLVYGDTNSTLAGALAAAKLNIPVAHVEAGLRSFNRSMPEEINRVMTDHVSDLLFAPTQTAVDNLRNEGVTPEKVHCVGDVMFDAALYYGNIAENRSRIFESVNVTPGQYVLATVHRAENTDDRDRLTSIFDAFCELSQKITTVLPLHPRTRKALAKIGLLDKVLSSLQVIEPVGFLDMVMLEKHARLVATDSGGVQKEAFFHQVPCVTLRDETEWVELVELGWNHLLAPGDTTQLLEGLRLALNASPGKQAAPYGDGRSAHQIVDLLIRQ